MNISLIGAMLPHSIFIEENEVRIFLLNLSNADRASSDACRPLLFPLEELSSLLPKETAESLRVKLWVKEFLPNDYIKYFSSVGVSSQLAIDLSNGSISKILYDLLIINRYNVYGLSPTEYVNVRELNVNPYQLKK